MNFREYIRSSYQKHFQPKMYQKAFDSHLRQDPLGSLQRSTDPIA